MTPERRALAWTVARFTLAAACVVLVVVSQRTVGWANLGLMLLGLAGLLALLHSYNRTYR
jgi:hypothetical protein